MRQQEVQNGTKNADNQEVLLGTLEKHFNQTTSLEAIDADLT